MPNFRLLALIIFMAFATVVNSQTKPEPEARPTIDAQDSTWSFPVDIIESETEKLDRIKEESESRQREIDDLLAQQGMNSATQAMNEATQSIKKATWLAAWSSWASAILVAIGTYLILRTLALTRQANNAAQEAVSVTREIGIVQTQAYLKIEEAKANLVVKNFTNSPTICVVYNHLKISNRGLSPAYEVRVTTCVEIQTVSDGMMSRASDDIVFVQEISSILPQSFGKPESLQGLKIPEDGLKFIGAMGGRLSARFKISVTWENEFGRAQSAHYDLTADNQVSYSHFEGMPQFSGNPLVARG